MPPEVYGALSLAAKWCGREVPARGPYQRAAARRKRMAKVQKHVARALKYQANRENP